MTDTNEIYRERAATARRDAETADLANVRDRHLCAAAAWDAMANRGERTLRHRAETAARKATEAAAAELQGLDHAPAASPHRA